MPIIFMKICSLWRHAEFCAIGDGNHENVPPLRIEDGIASICGPRCSTPIAPHVDDCFLWQGRAKMVPDFVPLHRTPTFACTPSSIQGISADRASHSAPSIAQRKLQRESEVASVCVCVFERGETRKRRRKDGTGSEPSCINSRRKGGQCLHFALCTDPGMQPSAPSC